MVAKVILQVTNDDYGMLINGDRFVEFESGIDYVLKSDFPIWMTWTDDLIDVHVEHGKTDVLTAYNLTTPEHHVNNNNNLLYYIWEDRFGRMNGVPTGLWNKQMEDVIPAESGNVPISNFANNIIQEYVRYNTNGTFADLFNLEQIDYIPPRVIEFANNPNVHMPYQFVDSQRYLAIVVNGERLSEKEYSAEFIPGSDSHKIFLKNAVDGEIVLKTDLYHYAEGNGSKEVSFRVRQGDERSFYISNATKDCQRIFRGKGKPTMENKVDVHGLIDPYIMSNYPRIYDFMQAYYDLENINWTGQSYLKNMVAYTDVDKMELSDLDKKIRTIFTPTTHDDSDPRHLVKRLNDFYTSKGSVPSYKWMANVLFKKDLEFWRASDYVIKLSSGDWENLTRITISEEDVKAINQPEILRQIKIFRELDTDELVEQLVGYTIEGRSSAATAVVERFTIETFQRQKFYHLYVSLKTGEFEQSEPIDIKRISTQITINSKTFEAPEIGVVGFKIDEPGNRYVPGQSVEVVSLTGDGFDGYISRVGPNGEVREILIENPGWFFRPGDENPVIVQNDESSHKKDFDISKVFSERKVYIENDAVGFTEFRNNILPIELLNQGGIVIDNRWIVNTRGEMLDNIYAIMEVKSAIYFFGITDDAKSVGYFNVRDEFTRLPYDFEDTIVNVSSNGRTLFVLTTTSLVSFAVETLLDAIIPPPTIFPISGPNRGNLRSVFALATSLYGFTNDKLIEYDLRGNEKVVVEFPREVIFSHYIRKGGVYTLYMGAGSTLYLYQWYDGNPRLKATPIYGRVSEVVKLTNGVLNTLSGPSVLNDNNVYQDFSVGLDIQETTNTYMKTFKENINTSGFKYYGIFRKPMNDIKGAAIALSKDEVVEGYDSIEGRQIDLMYERLEGKSIDNPDIHQMIIAKKR